MLVEGWGGGGGYMWERQVGESDQYNVGIETGQHLNGRSGQGILLMDCYAWNPASLQEGNNET